MAQSQFSLLWNAHKMNICNGLSTLQQNGEFVDMTLAADGHLVKVHQVIIALASPFIKELITTANCSHPVVFLNKISSTTLSSILEYIYTGEVLVSIDNLSEFLQAGKELHIKGLEDMKLNDSFSFSQSMSQDDNRDCEMETLNDDSCYIEIAKPKDVHENFIVTSAEHYNEDSIRIINPNEYNTDGNEEDSITDAIKLSSGTIETLDSDKNLSVMQYTVSNQGSLQMILNRYVYYLKHTNRNNTRQWRCVDYLNNIKCPAYVITKDDIVIQRISAHIHPFHDKRILKKVRAGAVYSAITQAEQEGHNKKNQLNNE